MKFILSLLLLISTNVNAENRPWTDVEKGLFVANSALIVMDWSQTRYITRHPEYHETNPILGRYPSTQNVDMFFLGQLIGQYYLFDYLDESRLMFMAGLTINRISVINHNVNIGVKIRF
jgi:hypothetical protein